jgi:hypothetical protein
MTTPSFSAEALIAFTPSLITAFLSVPLASLYLSCKPVRMAKKFLVTQGTMVTDTDEDKVLKGDG